MSETPETTENVTNIETPRVILHPATLEIIKKLASLSERLKTTIAQVPSEDPIKQELIGEDNALGTVIIMLQQ